MGSPNFRDEHGTKHFFLFKQLWRSFLFRLENGKLVPMLRTVQNMFAHFQLIQWECTQLSTLCSFFLISPNEYVFLVLLIMQFKD